MDYERILTSVPVNKQAALVTSSSGQEESELKIMVAQVQYLTDAISSAKKHRHMSLSEVKRMGKEKLELQNKIRELKDRVKKKHKTSIEFYFMEVCRRELHKMDFQKYLKMAMDERGD